LADHQGVKATIVFKSGTPVLAKTFEGHEPQIGRLQTSWLSHKPLIPARTSHSCTTPLVGERLRYQNGSGASRAQWSKDDKIYTHVLNRGGRGVNSPADRLW